MTNAIPITAPITEAVLHRFWAKVVVDPSGCLMWAAGRSGGGYGAFDHGGRKVAAHRFAYTALVGPVPDGLELDHLCRTPACVRPDHLEPVTHRTNTLRSEAPTAVNAAKDGCANGHPYTEENTYYRAGGRDCRACKRDRSREWKRARRAAQTNEPLEVTQ